MVRDDSRSEASHPLRENVISDIKFIEEDLENVEKKCEKVNCMALYDAVMATFKLIYDLIFCCARGPEKVHPP